MLLHGLLCILVGREDADIAGRRTQEIVRANHEHLVAFGGGWLGHFGAQRIVVVTQRFHLSRAVWCARALGMEAEGSAADRHIYRAGTWFQLREIGSRTKAFVDIGVGRTARGGPPIDLQGDGRVTAG